MAVSIVLAKTRGFKFPCLTGDLSNLNKNTNMSRCRLFLAFSDIPEVGKLPYKEVCLDQFRDNFFYSNLHIQ